ncbi:MAG: hypothetical protein HN981_02530 [Candidatus Pacebacteria bacterium]|jgi:hypothetical protein|nr:hypothetical protein [Candidatus Paceibacterota bacterium]MBT6756460.1 hypothetical protein [Candidatus Paceibacterota bacterium]MBT6921246.1 hypothetical protein [Candidatus Paceibacterota bacterium]
MKIISMKQLRQKFAPIRKSLEKGESFLLMYRSKPLGVIRPYNPDEDIHLLYPGETPALPEAKKLRTLPEPTKIALEPSDTPQLSTTKQESLPDPLQKKEFSLPKVTKKNPNQINIQSKNQQKKENPLNRLGFKKAFT